MASESEFPRTFTLHLESKQYKQRCSNGITKDLYLELKTSFWDYFTEYFKITFISRIILEVGLKRSDGY